MPTQQYGEINGLKRENKSLSEEINSLKRKNKSLAYENKRLDEKLKKSKCQNSEILSSKSWKITEPIRRIKGIIRKFWTVLLLINACKLLQKYQKLNKD